MMDKNNRRKNCKDKILTNGICRKGGESLELRSKSEDLFKRLNEVIFDDYRIINLKIFIKVISNGWIDGTKYPKIRINFVHLWEIKIAAMLLKQVREEMAPFNRQVSKVIVT